MLLGPWIEACASRTRAIRLEVRQRAASAVRHVARQTRVQASWELNTGRRSLAAYERCRRKLSNHLSRATVPMYITGEQERAIDMMRNVDLVGMYGGDVARVIAELAYLNAAFGICEEEITDTLIYVANRRFGKSAMAGFDAAVGLLTLHGNVTQTNMDSSQAAMWLETTMKYMMLLVDDEEFGFSVNRYQGSSNFSILARYPQPSERVCEVLGGGHNARAAQGNRGHGNRARKVYQDELLLCSPAALEVRMPMLLMGAGMVGISSAPPTNAVANKLLTAVYPDETRIARVFMQRNVCSVCAGQEAALKIEIHCSHGVPNTNSVTSARHRERVKGMLKGFGDSAEREVMNMTFADVPEPVFSANRIDQWLSHVTATTRAEDAAPEVIGVATPHVDLLVFGVDPGSNGRGSDTACIALVLTYRVIVAEPSTPLPPAERRSALDYHCTVCVASTLCVKSPTVTACTRATGASSE